MKLVLVPLVSVVLAAAAAAQAQPQEALGVDWAGLVYRWDSSTISGPQLVGDTGLHQVNSLASDSRGTIFTAGTYNAPGLQQESIYQLDRDTGEVTLALGTDLPEIRGLAFAPDDTLFGLVSFNWSDGPFYLYEFDLAAGDYREIGNTQSVIQALAFGDGTLYGWKLATESSLSRGLITIDTTTAQVTDVNPVSDPAINVQGLAFQPDGRLYGAGTHIYTVDPATGAADRIGALGAYVRGLEFLPPLTGSKADATARRDGSGSRGLPAQHRPVPAALPTRRRSE
ncbi:MAG: hypothetical protein AAF682_01885 [Planctomycetota bacterium]